MPKQNLNKLEGVKKEINIIIEQLNSKTCCFSGHRPKSLPWGFDEQDERCVKMKGKLKEEIIKAIKSGYDTFLCGMALGFDMIVAEMILELKENDSFKHIKLIGALPCKNQERLWKEGEKFRYHNLLAKLDGTRCIYDNYVGAKCMLERNKFMVNNSSLLIALFNGTSGGTEKTIRYAQKQGIDIVLIVP